jgi:hypothetical protein
MHWGDGRVLQLSGDARLVGEAAGGAGVGGELVLQHLDGHLAAEHGVHGYEVNTVSFAHYYNQMG